MTVTVGLTARIERVLMELSMLIAERPGLAVYNTHVSKGTYSISTLFILSPSIIYALLLTCSASVRRLFLLSRRL